MTNLKPIAILGAGSWGTALALYLARRGQAVRIFSIERSEILAMQRDRANQQFLPGFDFPDTLHPMLSLSDAIKDVEDILVVVPSIGFRSVLSLLKPFIHSQVRIISATKGIDAQTGQLLHEVVAEVLGTDRYFAALSGPSFAKEVAAGLPTAVVIASHHREFAEELVQRFDSAIFRTQVSNDVVGVELGGVAKNVIAIATGIADGLAFGTNCRSVLITLGLKEIIHLGQALGAQFDTFVGLAGIGDLMLTCSDNQSRNRRLGLAIGKGNNLKQAEGEIGQAIEGKRNAELITELALRHQVNMPICQAVWEVLQNKLNAKDAIERMLGCI